MKDIEMFSAGIAQQLNRRQDKINKALPHLQSGEWIVNHIICKVSSYIIVTEISQSLDSISSLLESCVPLMNRINNSLPEQYRLEQLTMHTSSPSQHSTNIGLLQDQIYMREDSTSSEEET